MWNDFFLGKAEGNGGGREQISCSDQATIQKRR
jgi:hypothetical protein